MIYFRPTNRGEPHVQVAGGNRMMGNLQLIDGSHVKMKIGVVSESPTKPHQDHGKVTTTNYSVFHPLNGF